MIASSWERLHPHFLSLSQPSVEWQWSVMKTQHGGQVRKRVSLRLKLACVSSQSGSDLQKELRLKIPACGWRAVYYGMSTGFGLARFSAGGSARPRICGAGIHRREQEHEREEVAAVCSHHRSCTTDPTAGSQQRMQRRRGFLLALTHAPGTRVSHDRR
ncbi:uncharacterized [Tachysurus ichikawai]